MEEMQSYTSCVPAGESADSCFSMAKNINPLKSELNLSPYWRSTAATPQSGNQAGWERLLKGTDGLMTTNKRCEIKEH